MSLPKSAFGGTCGFITIRLNVCPTPTGFGEAMPKHHVGILSWNLVQRSILLADASAVVFGQFIPWSMAVCVAVLNAFVDSRALSDIAIDIINIAIINIARVLFFCIFSFSPICIGQN